MYQPLAPCPGCRRHVRATARACPFCASALAVAYTAPSAAGRIARGALFVFASTVGACGSSTTSEPVTTDSGVDTGVIDSGADDGTVDDTGAPMTKYGAPPIPDASTD